MPTVEPVTLERSISDVLEAAGAPADAAGVVAESLVLSNLKGVDSHGLVRVEQYLGEIESAWIVPSARPSVHEQEGRIHVDACRGFGQVAAREAAQLAAGRAREEGIAFVTVANVGHVGRLGETVERAAAGGCLALAVCNTGPAGGRVAPYGGRSALFGTNPIAFAVPTASGPPIVADFSTSVTAEGRVRLAHQNGQRVPPGWIVDAAGNPTDDPAALYEGGAILPAGGHKGSALGLLAEILGGLVAGAGCAALGTDPGNGLALLTLHPAPEGVDALVEAVRAVPPAPGFDRVRAPGDPEAETEQVRLREGIPIPDATWAGFVAVAARYGVAVT